MLNQFAVSVDFQHRSPPDDFGAFIVFLIQCAGHTGILPVEPVGAFKVIGDAVIMYRAQIIVLAGFGLNRAIA